MDCCPSAKARSKSSQPSPSGARFSRVLASRPPLSCGMWRSCDVTCGVLNLPSPSPRCPVTRRTWLVSTVGAVASSTAAGAITAAPAPSRINSLSHAAARRHSIVARAGVGGICRAHVSGTDVQAVACASCSVHKQFSAAPVTEAQIEATQYDGRKDCTRAAIATQPNKPEEFRNRSAGDHVF